MTAQLVGDLGLAALTLAMIAYCVILDRRLRALRSGQDNLGKLVGDLTEATDKADRTLAAYRMLGDDRHRRLDTLMDEARAVADELQFLSRRAPVADKEPGPTVEGALAEALRAAR